MIDFNNRLKKLKDRRQGTRQSLLLASNRSIYDSADLRKSEEYENLAESSGVKYAIGAMAPVSDESTKISIREGERVATTLISLLKTSGIYASMEIQGSVALDIHIEGHSDVDMLILNEDTILVQNAARCPTFIPALDKRPMVEIIKDLRIKSEQKLTSRYPEVDVNCAGSKSIAMEGGSLQRKIDIVPSCWYNTDDYQKSGLKHDRAVQVYDKKEHKLISNQPFLHLKKVSDRDAKYSGNLRRVIRLMKNIVADMPDDKKRKAKKLSSYDLTAIGYHMDSDLDAPYYQALSLVEKTRSNLSLLAYSEVLRAFVDVPDGSRKVFDNDEKIEALNILSHEVDSLAKAIHRDIRPQEFNYDSKAITEKYLF
jgi:hypothetical protein